jgi:hypothetical protein
MVILVCGGRDYADREAVFRILDHLLRTRGIVLIIQGGARGADALAGAWARERGIENLEFRADWDRYGRSAGLRRNTQMLVEGRPDAVVAFPGGRGTANMVMQARGAGVPVWEPMKSRT